MEDEPIKEPSVCPICGSPKHRSRTGHMFWEYEMEMKIREGNRSQ